MYIYIIFLYIYKDLYTDIYVFAVHIYIYIFEYVHAYITKKTAVKFPRPGVCHPSESCCPGRLIFEREIGPEDFEFLLQTSKAFEDAFIAVVSRDLTYKVYTLPPTQNDADAEAHLINMEVLEVDNFLRAPKKGIFATLLSGFWFVKDRLCKVALKEEIETGITAEGQAEHQKVEMLGERTDYVQNDDLPPVEDADYIQTAIAIMENMAAKPVDSPMGSEKVCQLRFCSQAEPCVRECLRAFPQWQTGHVQGKQPWQWQEGADALRAMRSRTLCAKIRLRTEESLPLLCSPENAEEFLQWLLEEVASSEDIRHFMLDLEPSSVGSTNTPNVMVFAAKVLSLFTKVP